MFGAASTALQIEGYELGNVLGGGAVGKVFFARHLPTDRPCALKVVSFADIIPERAQVVRTRFRRESLLTLSLDHPHLVRGYDADFSGDVAFLAMEHVAGPSLADILDRAGPVPVPAATIILAQLAEALTYLRKRQIVHRDIKPANVIVSRGGVAKLCDFGLSRDPYVVSARITESGVPLGTLGTMPPEQVMGGHGADHRADLYSLGATIWWILNGRPLFDARELRDVLNGILDAEAPRLSERHPDLDPELVDLVASLLQKDPEKRPISPDEVGDKIGPILERAGLADPRKTRQILAEFAGVAPPTSPSGCAPLSSAATSPDRPVGKLPVISDAPTRGKTLLAGPPLPSELPWTETPTQSTDAGLQIVEPEAFAGGIELSMRLRGGKADVVRPMKVGDHFTIGRSPDAEVCIPLGWVSRRHCRVELTDRGLVVTDLGSANRTCVNEKPIMKALLRHGDELRLGRSQLGIELREVAAASDVEGPSASAIELRCGGCGRLMSLAMFLDGEVISLDRGFVCPACAEPDREVEFALERRLLDALLEAGYEVLERLDLGGKTPVFKAKKFGPGPAQEVGAKAERLLAIRVLPGISGALALAPLEAAKKVIDLRHPNIARLIDVRHKDDLLLVVHEFIEGETVKARTSRGGVFSSAQSVAIGLGLARALSFAADQRIGHGHLDPDQVMLGVNGEVKVLGVGLATAARAGSSSAQQESSLGDGHGCYVAPEQIQGAAATGVAADVYAFGATMFHVLTGEAPLRLKVARRETDSSSSGLRIDPTRPLHEREDVDAPPPLRSLVMSALSPDPTARPEDFSQILAPLEHLASALQERVEVDMVDLAESDHGASGVSTLATDPCRTITIRASDHAGRIQGRELLDFVGLLGIQRKSGVLAVVSAGRKIHLYIAEGELVHVTPLNLDAHQAALWAVGARDGAYRFRSGVPAGPQGARRFGLIQIVGEVERLRSERKLRKSQRLREPKRSAPPPGS